MELPIEIKIAFADQIESVALGWRDGIQSYEEFQSTLNRMCQNIYEAGYKEGKNQKDFDQRR